MSQEVQSNRSGLLILALYVGVPGFLLIGLVVFLYLGGPTLTETGGVPKGPERQENHLAAVRSMLAKQPDLATCKTAVPELNAHLQKAKEHTPALLDTRGKAALAQKWRLSTDDLEEVASSTFTALDAQHLESSFLFRDAARQMELATPGGRGGKVKQTPLNRAELAFAWVMREVRLSPRASTNAAREMLLPLAFALRRGFGSPEQRALVFLAVLEQLGVEEDSSSWLHGALLFCPDEKGSRRLWACGVAIGPEPDALYLFDPRLGLPIPGPDGKGVATLAQARNDPKVLRQLDAGHLHYDVTIEHARESEVCLFRTLSALAPRMALLQDRLLRDKTWNDQHLADPLFVRLAADVPGALRALQTAVKKSGSSSQVHEWPDGAGILRRFLSREEGGSDATQIVRLRAEDTMVPWDDFQKLYDGPSRFFTPEEVVGLQLKLTYREFFLQSFRDPSSPRELILRGRFGPQATTTLTNEQGHWQNMRYRLRQSKDLFKAVRKWVEVATAVFADALRARGTSDEAVANARRAELMKAMANPDEPIVVLLHGTAAQGRGAEVTYQLGLCLHETAARLQARRELAARGKVERPEDGIRVADAAKNAEFHWRDYTSEYPDRPAINAVALRQSEAQAMRGDIQSAIRTLENAPIAASDLEKLARLWLIGQLKKRLKEK